MRPIAVSDLISLVVGHVLAVVTACASMYGAWYWLVMEHPFK